MRIVTYRSNAWLISANLAVLVLTIYACSLVNFAGLIASYNVSHSRDAALAGRPIDLSYLIALGPQAIPALDRYLAAEPRSGLSFSKFPAMNSPPRIARPPKAGAPGHFAAARLTRYLEAHQP